MRTIRIVGLLVWLVFGYGYFTPSMAEVIEGRVRVVSGVVRDKESRKKLENVNIFLVGQNIGTVSNTDGEFSLKLAEADSTSDIEISHVGYQSARLPVKALEKTGRKEVTIWLTPVTMRLDEILVFGGDARLLVEEALRKIPENYATGSNMLDMFYRETIQKRRRYIGISEAVMDVYKTDYEHRNVNADKVQLVKSRRLLSQKPSDTLAIKVVGGPNLAISMDVVKNPDALLDKQSLNFYDFTIDVPTKLDDRLQYVVTFRPRVVLPYALFSGKLYIDKERLALTRAEFTLDLSDRTKAESAVLRKKPLGLRFRLQEVSFLVSYRQQGERTYLNYIRNVIRFNCDWRRRLFSSVYTAFSEMVVVDRDEHPTRVIQRKEAFRPRQIFYDSVDSYQDPDFWANYNIIQPTESLEHAVHNLVKKNRKR